MCLEYCVCVNMYHVSAQGVDAGMINVQFDVDDDDDDDDDCVVSRTVSQLVALTCFGDLRYDSI